MTESFEHYASKYYDPVKAHEYYMKTRRLKGYDTQGKTLNDEGKQAKAYITKRIREERYSVLKKNGVIGIKRFIHLQWKWLIRFVSCNCK